jgi:hypothetical protein
MAAALSRSVEFSRAVDPTRCTDLRNRCISQYRRGIAAWKRDITAVVSTQMPMTPEERTQKFNSFIRYSSEKSFDVRTVVPALLGLAYKRGYQMAYSERGQLQRSHRHDSLSLYGQLLFAETKATIESAIALMTRNMSAGALRESTPFQLRQATSYRVQKALLSKLKTSVNTYVTMAYNHGKLAGYEELGVEKVGVTAERIPGPVHHADSSSHHTQHVLVATAGDLKVCDHCKALEGQTYTLREARALLPRHPSCRCVVISAEG